MRGMIISCVIGLLGVSVWVFPAVAEVRISIDKTTQRMTVVVDGEQLYSWPVSTGIAYYATPAGSFTPSRLARVHFSKEWDGAPMPHSIFFTDEGHAIHGSDAVRRLGTPASHGCVRLARAHARTLFDLVAAQGLGNARIEITGIDSIATGFGRGSGGARDYGRLTSFDPLAAGIMVGGAASRQRDAR